MKRIVINQNKCIGCQTCVVIAPKTFGVGKNGKVEVINQSEAESKEVKEAIASCPVGAISLKKV